MQSYWYNLYLKLLSYLNALSINVLFLFILVSKPAPFWKATAVVNGHVTELKLSDYNGRYLVLFFYPQDL